MGLGFFDIYSSWVHEIESVYYVPESENFQRRNFEKVSFHSPQDRRFFTIIKILAENGPCTEREIVHLFTVKNKISYKSENELYTLLNGRKNQVISLQERGVVVSSKLLSKDKREKKFALSYFGIFYAIKLFFGSNIYEYSYPPFKRNHDFSDQKNSQTIIDLIAKNHTWALPLIFDKWEYLKQNRYINAHYLAKLASERHFYFKIPLDMFDEIGDDTINELEHPITNNSFNDIITAIFYFEQQQLFDSPVTKNISKLIKDKEINNFLTKVLVIYRNYITEQNIILKNYQRQFSERNKLLLTL